MTQKQLRAIARDTVGKILKGTAIADSVILNAAIQVLHAPNVKGE